MRTLFLLGILGTLIVIATKKDNQTAMEAAMELGQKAQSIVNEYDKERVVNSVLKRVKETSKTTDDQEDPFNLQITEVIAGSKDISPLKVQEPETNKVAERVTPPVALKLAVKEKTPIEKTPIEKTQWTMPKPRKQVMPEIPALPKTPVEELDLATDVVVEVAKVKPTAIDVGRSYDLVKGYYENASRLLEEIK